jgi:ubiquinone/menaquinone biosynthesis C-methylase UbiE
MSKENDFPRMETEKNLPNFFVGSVPQNYETQMGPILFGPYATDLVSRIHVAQNMRVLELAAGTGQVTRLLTQSLPDAEIIASDISDDMMAVGQSMVQSTAVHWQNIDMMDIPFEDNSFDLIICQFGLMFAPDKSKALREIYRVLKTDGQFLFNTWGDIAENRMWQINFLLFDQVFRKQPMPKEFGPFGLDDFAQLKSLVTGAGFTISIAEELRKTTTVKTAKSAAERFLLTAPILASRPELYPDMLKQLEKNLGDQLGYEPLVSPLMALVIEATKA